VFGRAGISDGNPNPIEWFLSFGVGGNSRLPGREDDRFGIGWYYNGLSDEFGPVLSAVLDDGQGVELYYDIALSERCRLALDLQIVEPNLIGVDTALVPGIRSHIEF
jgi:porin